MPDSELHTLVFFGVGVKDFDEFKRKLKACQIKMNGTVVFCETIDGDRLTLDTSFPKVPTIDAKPVN